MEVNVITIEIRKYYPGSLHSSQFRGFSKSQILDNLSKLKKILLQLHLLRLFFNGNSLECSVQEFVKKSKSSENFFFNNKATKNLFIDVAVNSKLWSTINQSWFRGLMLIKIWSQRTKMG